MSWLGSPTLIAERVTLRPFVIDDAAQLGAVVTDVAPYRWTSVPVGTEASEAYIRTAFDDPSRQAFAVVDNDSNQIVGSTSYYDIDETHCSLAVGYTFYGTSVQGTTVNPTSKFLLLKHAFEDCGAVRVVWHTHAENAQSRAAIAKLGAEFEGLLRKQKRFGDSWRTTAQYAMIDDDWPAAKARLEQRMGG